MTKRCPACDGYRKVNTGGIMKNCTGCNGTGLVVEEEKKKDKDKKKES